MADVRVNMEAVPNVQGNSPEQKKPSHGWTPDARKLVKMWAGQMAVNRLRHQANADAMSGKSTSMKIAGAVFGSASAFLSFIATTFTNEPYVIIGMNIGAGLCAALATLIGVILAIYGLDGEAEKNRQTAIQYANVCNEAQTVLVEEHEENLPQATEFLRRMKDLTHLIQLFGPPLEVQSNSDMPSMILLRGITSGVAAAPVTSGVVDEYAGIFDHDDRIDNSPQHRKKKRADMLDELKRDRENIKKRQDELNAEENELKVLSRMLSLQADLGADPRSKSGIFDSDKPRADVVIATPPKDAKSATSVSAPAVLAAQAPIEVPAKQAPTDSDESGEWTEEDASEVTHQAVVGDRISPIVRSALRASTFPSIPTAPHDNIAIDLENIPTSSTNSRTQSGENLEDDMEEHRRTLTELALGSIGKIGAGVKKMQIAPEVLRAEIRRREDKIRSQKRELADKKRMNQNLRREIETAQIVQPAPRRTSNTTLDKKNTSDQITASPRRVMDRIKGALSQKPSGDIHDVQREKLDAIRELCGDDLSFECMREDV